MNQATTEPRSLSDRVKKPHRAMKDEPSNYGGPGSSRVSRWTEPGP